MGCDIHMAVEVRRDGQWVTANKWSEEDSWFDVVDEVYGDRNYSLFGVLAGVRQDIDNKIDAPRGVPDDASREYKRWVDQWSGDGHSHSFLTLQELVDHDWTTSLQNEGWVSLVDWARYVSFGRPESWAGMVGGGGTIHADPSSMALVRAKLYGEDKPYDLAWPDKRGDDARKRFAEALKEYYPDLKDDSRVYTFIRWEVPQFEYCSHFLSEGIPKLHAIRMHRKIQSLCDVRVVFFFDN